MIPKILLLYLFFLCKLSISKRISPDLSSLRTGKLEDCQRCKILTDSFKHWLSGTSRGKHEGGDAAWEEAKLKSYSRSEMRLVEIQEGLCSELKKYQDHCYTLAEEVEQVLEKWWFYEDPETVDLYTWLCIDNLQYCCPPNHFSESCIPCPLDKNNKLCGGHGKCDGDGTRKGNGTCICHTGYTGNYCEECSKNFYLSNSICMPCHKACDGCSGEGVNSCNKCKNGWIMQSKSCIDIDECSSSSLCKENQYCVNREGSYKCKNCDPSCKSCKGDGSANCTLCDDMYTLWSGKCVGKEQKYEIVFNVAKRLTLYIGLLIISVFIFRNNKYFAAFTIVIIAIYIFTLENSSTVNLLELILNMN
ncbi:cysteine-rich with EGF-like domain protein 2 [Manduca sexta]|uniref:cysteine-rich with EGF-like domain protein 2 n=1 Tax=Manduca sexta TaxID=7130 RepID=UPI00188F0082|nr:cysteine-rich with EGF-like domain protein 2 [Manduca sexta]